MTNTTDPYPELSRRHAVIESGDSQIIGEFLEWAEHRGYRLMKTVTTEVLDWRGNPTEEEGEVPVNVEQALAEYFEIDMAKVEAERRELLAKVRRDQEADT